jgi:hypothetical protein
MAQNNHVELKEKLYEQYGIYAPMRITIKDLEFESEGEFMDFMETLKNEAQKFGYILKIDKIDEESLVYRR